MASMDSAAARPDEEEVRRRRNTDCIYFLASPLTCNKGSECEFRHSDAARMNPRDCWYWFNGNCANPKCSFRHPPLDNLLGPPTTPRAPQQPAPQVPVPAQAHGSVPAKQGVPCYYFQKGMCAKGDRCAFSHGPQSAGNPAPQPAAAAKVFTPALQLPQLKNSWTKSNSSPQRNMPAGIPVDNSKLSAHDAKPVQKQHVTSRVDHSSRIYQNHINSYAQSGTTKHYQPQPSVEDDLTENCMEVGEFVRESSGVLVGGVHDDTEQSFKGNHSSYHHRTNGTGISRQTHGGYEPERPYRSSAAERLLSDKRISQREPMPAVTAGGSDLRQRLLKQRRLNSNSRSTEAPNTNDVYHEGERNDQHRWRGEDHDGPLSRSRLRDRIRLPGETPFDRLGSSSEKEWDRGPRGRLSPPKHPDLRGKLHERLKARSAEELPGNSAKSLVAKASNGEDAGSLNFAGPKSLAELKAKKVVDSSSGEDAIVKGIGSSRLTSEVISSGEPAPFEGPKALSAILKRKREAASENAAAHSGGIQEDDDAVEVDEESQILVTVGENMEGNTEEEDWEEEAFNPEDDVAYDDNADEAADQELEEHQDVEAAAEDYNYEAADANAEAGQEQEEHQDVEAATEDYDEAADQELEEHQDVEAAAEDYDYEAADANADAGQEQEEHQDVEAATEDYEYEAADVNAEEDNEYQEYQDDDDDMEDDDDDFARKVGVMIS